MANHPSRGLAAEARRRVSRVFRTGSGDLGWGFRVTNPGESGASRIIDSGSYQQAIEHRRQALAEMIDTLRAQSST